MYVWLDFGNGNLPYPIIRKVLYSILHFEKRILCLVILMCMQPVGPTGTES